MRALAQSIFFVFLHSTFYRQCNLGTCAMNGGVHFVESFIDPDYGISEIS